MRFMAVMAGLFTASILIGASVPAVKAQSQNSEDQLPKTITIEPGDTLSAIAVRFSTTYQRLFDANTKIQDPDLIYAGDDLRIPHPDETLEPRALPANAPAPQPTTNNPGTVQAAPLPAPAPKTNPDPQPSAIAPPPAPTPVPSTSGSVWDKLAMCESSGNWHINTGNGFYGGLQFTLSSWRAVGGSGYPHEASKAEQIARAEKLLAIQGWGAWPACSAKLGLY